MKIWPLYDFIVQNWPKFQKVFQKFKKFVESQVECSDFVLCFQFLIYCKFSEYNSFQIENSKTFNLEEFATLSLCFPKADLIFILIFF